MQEKLKNEETISFKDDFNELIKKHGITGALYIIEKEDSCQFATHNLSYEEVKDHLCYANYCNEKYYVEMCEEIDAIEAAEAKAQKN